MPQLTLELNIALIPTKETGEQLVSISEGLASRHPAVITLDMPGTRLGLTPHLTLYQVPLPIAALPNASSRLEEVAIQAHIGDLQAIRYAYNEGEASFEVQREITPALREFQEQVLAILNPLRGNLLLERDPSGVPLTHALQDTGELGDNIRVYGYSEIGSLFRPHDTTNWFTPGTTIDISTEPLPDPAMLAGNYESLGIFALGPHGTCPQLIVQHPLG